MPSVYGGSSSTYGVAVYGGSNYTSSTLSQAVGGIGSEQNSPPPGGTKLKAARNRAKATREKVKSKSYN